MSQPDPFTAFIAPSTPPVQASARALRALILSVFPDAIEQFDPPAKLIGYGIDRTYKGLVCGITLHKAHANLMFARGTELADPAKLLIGTGKRARHVRISTPADIDEAAITDLLRQAVTLASA